MKKYYVIVWGIIFFAYLLFVYGLKDGFILRGWIAFSTLNAINTFRSYFDIAILVLLSYLSLMFFFNQKKKRFYLKASICFSFFLVFSFLSGQVVARDPDNVGEFFLLFSIRSEKYIDRELLEFNYGGYDENYHYNKDYPCYEYCEDFFFRYYQIGKNDKVFKVFKGIGPFFSFPNDRRGIYKNK